MITVQSNVKVGKDTAIHGQKSIVRKHVASVVSMSDRIDSFITLRIQAIIIIELNIIYFNLFLNLQGLIPLHIQRQTITMHVAYRMVFTNDVDAMFTGMCVKPCVILMPIARDMQKNHERRTKSLSAKQVLVRHVQTDVIVHQMLVMLGNHILKPLVDQDT